MEPAEVKELFNTVFRNCKNQPVFYISLVDIDGESKIINVYPVINSTGKSIIILDELTTIPVGKDLEIDDIKEMINSMITNSYAIYIEGLKCNIINWTGRYVGCIFDYDVENGYNMVHCSISFSDDIKDATIFKIIDNEAVKAFTVAGLSDIAVTANTEHGTCNKLLDIKYI